jgi:hypothetical protein
LLFAFGYFHFSFFLLLVLFCGDHAGILSLISSVSDSSLLMLFSTVS